MYDLRAHSHADMLDTSLRCTDAVFFFFLVEP